jgi:hypothetical protein
MVQGLSQMYRIHQSCSDLVFPVKLVDAFACDHKRSSHSIIKSNAR